VRAVSTFINCISFPGPAVGAFTDHDMVRRVKRLFSGTANSQVSYFRGPMSTRLVADAMMLFLLATCP
jgi:hypothetical protein